MHFSGPPAKNVLWNLLCLLRDLDVLTTERMHDAYDTTWKREHR
jgi:hypothetical protein